MQYIMYPLFVVPFEQLWFNLSALIDSIKMHGIG